MNGDGDSTLALGDGAAGTENLKTTQESAILALLNEPSVPRAAASAGVGERTLRRWLLDPDFAAAYRRARRQSFEQAIALTQRYSSLAVQTLATAMTSANAPWTCKVTAAVGLLRFGREGIELEDLAERVKALEVEGPRSFAAGQAGALADATDTELIEIAQRTGLLKETG